MEYIYKRSIYIMDSNCIWWRYDPSPGDEFQLGVAEKQNVFHKNLGPGDEFHFISNFKL